MQKLKLVVLAAGAQAETSAQDCAMLDQYRSCAGIG